MGVPLQGPQDFYQSEGSWLVLVWDTHGHISVTRGAFAVFPEGQQRPKKESLGVRVGATCNPSPGSRQTCNFSWRKQNNPKHILKREAPNASMLAFSQKDVRASPL